MFYLPSCRIPPPAKSRRRPINSYILVAHTDVAQDCCVIFLVYPSGDKPRPPHPLVIRCGSGVVLFFHRHILAPPPPLAGDGSLFFRHFACLWFLTAGMSCIFILGRWRLLGFVASPSRGSGGINGGFERPHLLKIRRQVRVGERQRVLQNC